MSTWALILAATALGGAFVLWQTIARAKYASEQMLKQYEQMLAAARSERAKELAKDSEKGSSEPEEVH